VRTIKIFEGGGAGGGLPPIHIPEAIAAKAAPTKNGFVAQIGSTKNGFVGGASAPIGSPPIQPFGFVALYRAWQACRRGKRGTRKAQRYEMRLLDNLVNTAQELQQHTWHPSRATRFVTLHPKPREILAADFGDRVVHHVLVPWFEKHFEPVFIHDSFANRRGKGAHAAVDRLQAFMRMAVGSIGAKALPARDGFVGGASAPIHPVLKPHCVPMRILPDGTSQTGTHGIGDDVARDMLQIFPIADGVVVETGLPDGRAGRVAALVDGASAQGFVSLKQIGESSASQLKQPMQMVGHQHEGQSAAQIRLVASAQFPNCQSGQVEIGEQGQTILSHRGDKIASSDFGGTANAQVATMRKFVHGEHHARIIEHEGGDVGRFVGGALAPIDLEPIIGAKAPPAAVSTAPSTKTDNFTRGVCYLQLDIANFFHSIDRRRLFEMLRHRIERDMRRSADDPRYADAESAQEMLHLARVLLTGNPALNADYRGNPAHLNRVPEHKQLANAAPEKGLPIGNLTSQFFANVYLNELDQFVKHTLKVHHYVRYVDDFVLLHNDRTVLEAWRTAIIDFLRDRLGLTLRDIGRLAPISNGIDFLGYIIRPDYRLVRRRVVGHMKARMAGHEKRIVRSNGTLVSSPAASDAVQATLASYFGHFRHARSAGLQGEVFAAYPWLGHILERERFDTLLIAAKAAPTKTGKPAGGFVGGASAPNCPESTIAAKAAPTQLPVESRLKRVDRPGVVTSLASQWSYFRYRYPHHVLLMQVGNRWECQGTKDAEIPSVFRRFSSNRAGLPQTWAIPAARVPALKRLLTRRRQPWCEVCENGYLKGGMKRRQFVALWPALPVGTGLAANNSAKDIATKTGKPAGGFVGGASAPNRPESTIAAKAAPTRDALIEDKAVQKAQYQAGAASSAYASPTPTESIQENSP
jgi:retron-type reverse transcriptase